MKPATGKRHYRDDQDDPDSTRTCCGQDPATLRGAIMDPPENIDGMLPGDCGLCANIMKRRWQRELREQNSPRIRHYLQEQRNDWEQAPRTMCGHTAGTEPPPASPPAGPELIEPNDCRSCVRLLTQRWQKPGRTPKRPLEHIRKPGDFVTVLCGRRLDSLETPPAPYPAELAPELPANAGRQCRSCRQNWRRRERRPVTNQQWQ